MKPTIQAERLSKYYRMGTVGFRTLKEDAQELWLDFKKSIGLSVRRSKRPSRNHPQLEPHQVGPRPNTFWAIRDISFTCNPGEIIGIAGKNGCGKSTLLKVLSRITMPSQGRAIIRGRLSSLLEVGAGFHSELTGTENVFLYGAILGMRRIEVSQRFNRIVAFSEVGDFIDTPVKHYSSGMYVRLAFSVATHLESDIMIFDEILAVADAGFQKKCLQRAKELAKDGKTILLVSHDATTLSELCDRCLFLQKGVLIDSGKPAAMLEKLRA